MTAAHDANRGRLVHVPSEVVARYDVATRVAGVALGGLGAAGAALALPLILGIPVAMLLIALAVRWWRVALLADQEHLTVRNVARTHVVPWHEIDGYELCDDRLELNVAGRTRPVFMEATKQVSLRSSSRTRRIQAMLDRLVAHAKAADERAT